MTSEIAGDGRLRSRGRKLAVGTGAAIVAALVATGSVAQVSGSTTTLKLDAVSPGTTERHVISGGGFQAPGVQNDAGIGFSTFSGAAEDPFVIIDSNAHASNGKLGVSLVFDAGFNRDRSQTISNASAGVLVTDSLDISSTGGNGREVTLHKTLDLKSLINFVNDAQVREGDNFSGTASDKLQISGSGIGLSAHGDDTFMSNLLVQQPNFAAVTSRAPPETIDFALNFILGEAQSFDINMLLSVVGNMNDRDGTVFGRQEIEGGFELTWADGGTLTDALTGQAVCGASSSSDSGFNYLRGIASSPCDVGGGGDGGGGGTGGGVPEPASWALMILGFGVSGGLLRRRRASEQASA